MNDDLNSMTGEQLQAALTAAQNSRTWKTSAGLRWVRLVFTLARQS